MSDPATAAARHSLYAEDLQIGEPVDLGTYQLSTEDIVDFASRWDPLPIHIDRAAAAAGPFGELIASGVQTMAVYQRLAVLGAFRSWRVVAGRAVRDVELTAPVRAGDVLRATLTVLEVHPARPDRSLVVARGQVMRGAGTVVLTLISESYVETRRAALDHTSVRNR